MIVMENWRIDFVSMGFISSPCHPTMNRRAIRTKSAPSGLNHSRHQSHLLSREFFQKEA